MGGRWSLPLVLAGLVVFSVIGLATGMVIGLGYEGPEPTRSTMNGTENDLANEQVVETYTTIDGDASVGESIAAGDVTGNGVSDVLVGEPFNDTAGENAGAAHLFFGPVESESLRTADADVTIRGEQSGDWAGYVVTVADVSGNGHGDIIVGAPLRNQRTGAVYVIYGSEELSGTISLADADLILDGVEPGSHAGHSIAPVGGSEGVGLLVGAPRADTTGEEAGAAYYLSHPELHSAGSLADAELTLVGQSPGEMAGWSVAAANLTGDAGDELVVGARRNGQFATRAGAVYVTSPDQSGTHSLSDAAVTVFGPEQGSRAGFAVANAGNLTGSGYEDLVIGAPFDRSGGSVYLVSGAESLPTSIQLSETEPLFEGEAAGDRAGWDVDSAGDLNCDGVGDVLVGAPNHDGAGADAGAAYAVFGTESTAEGGTGSIVGSGGYERVNAGTWSGAYAGYRVADAGDVTGDGNSDVLVGAPDNDSAAVTGPETRGAVTILSGSCPVTSMGATPTLGATPSDAAESTASNRTSAEYEEPVSPVLSIVERSFLVGAALATLLFVAVISRLQ